LDRLHSWVSGCAAAHNVNPTNTDYLASLDAVTDGGIIRCWVSTQPQFANLYPGCVPTNITDPDNIGASIGECWGDNRPR
jgi:hypothetical protein